MLYLVFKDNHISSVIHNYEYKCQLFKNNGLK